MAKTNIERAQRLMMRHPKMTAKQLADEMGITLNYSYGLRAQIKKRKDKLPMTRAEIMAKARAAKKAKAMATNMKPAELPVRGKGDEYEVEQGAWKVVAHYTSDKSIKDVPKPNKPSVDMVNHPPHYKVGGIETIDFIEAKKLGYNLGNVVKYITRADHKGERLENLQKALWYLNRELATHP